MQLNDISSNNTIAISKYLYQIPLNVCDIIRIDNRIELHAMSSKRLVCIEHNVLRDTIIRKSIENKQLII